MRPFPEAQCCSTHLCVFFYLRNPQHMAVYFNTKLLICLVMIQADPPERDGTPPPLRSQQHVCGQVTPEIPKTQTTLRIQTEEAEVQSHPKKDKGLRVLSSALSCPSHHPSNSRQSPYWLVLDQSLRLCLKPNLPQQAA